MLTIWKFQLKTSDLVAINMPEGSKIISLQVQSSVPTIWALVNPAEMKIKTRYFRIYGTGHPIESKGDFVGTYQLSEGALVFHVFEVADYE